MRYLDVEICTARALVIFSILNAIEKICKNIAQDYFN